MPCPTCKRSLHLDDPGRAPYAPFCSERCRLADLGAWLDGAHRITSPLSDEDLDQVVPDADGDQSSRSN